MNWLSLASLALSSVFSVCAGSFDVAKLIPLLEFPGDTFEIGFSVTEEGVSFWSSSGTSENEQRMEIARAELQRATHPEDPVPHRTLGYLYRFRGHRELSEKMFEEAARLYRARLEKDPTDPSKNLEGLTRCLMEMDEREEAEVLLRKRAEFDPSDHVGWEGLGECAALAAYKMLTGRHFYSDRATDAYHEAMTRSFGEEQLRGIDRRMEEAEECYARAIKAAKEPARYYQRRIIFRFHVGVAREVAGKHGQADAYRTAFGNFLEKSRDDFRTIAKLQPANPQATAAEMFRELIAASLWNETPSPFSAEWMQKLPADAKANLREGMQRLKPLARRGESERKYGALVPLGFFQSLFGDKKEGEKNLWRAIELNREENLGWEVLGGMYSLETNRWKDLLALSRERAKFNDSARNRYLGAKAAEKLKDYQEAKRELEAALKLDSKHASAQLAMCVVLLREGSSERNEKARNIFQGLNERKDLSQDQWRDLVIIGGTCLAVFGEHEHAKTWFSTLAKEDPNHEGAAAALAAWQD